MEPAIVASARRASQELRRDGLAKWFIGAACGRSVPPIITALAPAIQTTKDMSPSAPIAARPELRHLRAFLAVAEQGSANRAGAALYRAQSAVSRSIRKLEDELGVELFERRARGMLLTQYGRALLVRARRVHAELQAARGDIAALADKGRVGNAPIFGMLTHERRVRAFVALAEQHHMPSVAESLGITQPAVSIAIRQIEDSIGVALFRRTARGTIPTPAGAALALRLKRALAEIRHAVRRDRVAARHDAGRGHPRRAAPARLRERPRGEPLAADELAIVCRSGHPSAARARLPAEELAQAQWVLSRVDTPNPDALRARAARAGSAATERDRRDERSRRASRHPDERRLLDRRVAAPDRLRARRGAFGG